MTDSTEARYLAREVRAALIAAESLRLGVELLCELRGHADPGLTKLIRDCAILGERQRYAATALHELTLSASSMLTTGRAA